LYLKQVKSFAPTIHHEFFFYQNYLIVFYTKPQNDPLKLVFDNLSSPV